MILNTCHQMDIYKNEKRITETITENFKRHPGVWVISGECFTGNNYSGPQIKGNPILSKRKSLKKKNYPKFQVT